MAEILPIWCRTLFNQSTSLEESRSIYIQNTVSTMKTKDSKTYVFF